MMKGSEFRKDVHKHEHLLLLEVSRPGFYDITSTVHESCFTDSKIHKRPI
jgi:hypothetical protein